MSLIVVFDLISFLALVVACMILWHGWKSTLSREVKLSLSGLLALALLHSFSNVLEWGGITKALDIFEDFFELLVPMLWFTFIYTFLRGISEHDLRESERRLKESQKIARLGQWEFDLVANRLYWSEGIYDIFAIDPDEFDASYAAFLDAVHPDDREFVAKSYADSLKDKTSYNIVHRLLLKGGTVKYVNEICRTEYDENGKPLRSLGTVQDITERKQAERELEESERQLRTIIEHTNELFFIHDTEHILTYVSQTSEDVLGYRPEEMMIKWPELATDNPVNQKGMEITEKGIATGEKQAPYLLELEKKDGTPVLLEIDESPIRDLTGKVVAISGAARDVTEQKQTEEKLLKSEKGFRDLFNSITDLIYAQDLDGRFISVNNAMSKVFGYERDELIGMYTSEFMKPEFASFFESEYLEKLKKYGHQEGTTVYLTKNSEKVYIEYRSSLVKPDDGEPYITGIGRDVTGKILSERKVKKLQQQLVQAQKMESIGTLAGGIAHNFNNVLMGIQGRTSLMMIDKEPSHPDFEHLKGIEEYVQSAAELTRDLLGFARGGKYEVSPTNLNDLIKHENRMFGQTKKEIGIKGKYEKKLWTVEVDQGQIRQVLLNLYVNAWHAMPEGGELYIQTENVMLDEDYVEPFELPTGRYVKISVTDTGTGMDEVTKEKIFEPFFTTQEMGTGTGLGLASVYGVIKNHGGFINVYSEKGEGTTFNIYLPASETEVIEGKKPSEEILKGEGTILLVDDEEMITDVGGQLLEKLGYRALTAKSGRETIPLYENNKADIDMVILDMIMPGMSGGETYDRLKEINPDIKVLLSSGYSINGQAKKILDRGCNAFIQKPFNLKELAKKVREVLDKK
ncbi:MAG: PAS domain S-box protein [Deltaproteobacteria bacterium]|nr:PAS domain S-box protein [Deltaproteobacteria bacterium]